MKTGRNGGDPPNKKQPTWEDVSRNEEIKSRNRATREKYESDMAAYNKAMKLYREGPDTKEEASVSSGSVKINKRPDFISAEKMNKDINEMFKRGEIVSIDDKTLDPAIKKSISSKFKGDRTDVFGTTGKRYVSKDSKDLKVYETYKTPESPSSPQYEKEEDIDVKRLPAIRMEKGKRKYGKLAMYEPTAPEEKPDWEEPKGAIKYRTKYSMPDISTTSKAKSLGRFVKSKVESIGKDNALSSGMKKEQGKARLIQGKSGREGKMAKAYFSGFEGKSKFDIVGTSEERGVIDKLKADKADLKERIKEVRKGVAPPSTIEKSERIQGLRAAKKDVKSQIKQARLASKYVSKLGQEYTGVREGQELRSTGKIKTFTPERMAGFSGSKQDTYSSDANFNKFLAKSSTDNPVNNNRTFGRKVKNK